MSDIPGRDGKVKTSEATYKAWIKNTYAANPNDHAKAAQVLASMCKADFNQFYSPKRTVWVAILNKPGCTRQDMEHGNVGSWPVMQFSRQNHVIIIKYTY